MEKDEAKSKLNILLKQLLESSTLSIEKAQEISLAFEDIYTRPLDKENFETSISELVAIYPELNSLLPQRSETPADYARSVLEEFSQEKYKYD